MSSLSHIDRNGEVNMVDVSQKTASVREASAAAHLQCAAETLSRVHSGAVPKGSIIAPAKIAAIMAAKRTADLIPLCHPLPLTHVDVEIKVDEQLPGFRVGVRVRTTGPTGVEMEALTAATVACLTLFDMLKAVDRNMVIGGIEVTAKQGGKSGRWGKA